MRLKTKLIEKRVSCLKDGFTLVELLVVISIIALLLAILMPSLQKARDQARKVMCTSNLRQMGIIWILYAEDNSGSLYVDKGGTDDPWMWWETIIEYERGSTDILTCPSQRLYKFYDSYEPGWHASNYPGDPRGGSRIGYPGSWKPPWVDIGYGYNMKIRPGHSKLSNFRKHNKMAIMAETGAFYWRNRLYGSAHGGWFADRHKKGDYDLLNNVINKPGAGCVVFIDGHTEWVKTPYPNGEGSFTYDIQDP